jgi:HAD superfamily hydrolase (TIGR01509 family)
MIRAVVFDMDGLLIDTEPLWFRARRELFQQHGLTWTEADQVKCMGVSTATWTELMADRLDGRMAPAEITEDIVNRMVAYYRAGEVELLPGAQAALELCRSNYPVGLASGSHKRLLAAAVEGMQWRSFFDEILSSDDCAAGKPAPDVYLEVIRRLGVRPAETAVLEDATSGILAGYAAGARVIAVPNHHLPPPEDVLAKADIVIDSLESLETALKQLG